MYCTSNKQRQLDRFNESDLWQIEDQPSKLQDNNFKWDMT